jgi:hypothetical protein
LLQFGPSTANPVWPGYTNIYPSQAPGSFQIPLQTNFAAVPVSMYRFNSGAPFLTTNLYLWYETNATGFGQNPQPHWGLTMTNNLQVIMVDHNTQRLIDYVQLMGPNSIRDISDEILTDDTNGFWNTALYKGMPAGISQQYSTSQGQNILTVNNNYNTALWGNTPQKTAYDGINGFRIFTMGAKTFLFTYTGYMPDPTQMGMAKTTNSMQMPYTPTATTVQDIVWQANDPLVHYMASDLINPTAGTGLQLHLNWPGNLGQLNQRYQPWGGSPATGMGTNLLAIKDPLVTCSDDWDFPDSQPLEVSWLGRVHRGTPWQTVYLKAPDVLSYPNNFGIYGLNGANVWVNWTGDVNATDAAAMSPVQDWHLASLLACMFNTNDLRSLFSANNPDPNAWQALLDGLTALTNNLTDVQLQSLTPPQFGVIVMSSNSPQASAIADAVEVARTGQPVQFFADVGDILAIPQLTVDSPFLNWSDNVQQQRGISDEAYEIIPSQLLPLLRADSIGSVATANGQVVVQFTGYDSHSYAIEVSSNLVDWTSISTNCPVGGVFSFTNSPTLNANPQFYRSILLN